MRLQKYLAHAGLASRRKSEELIKEGKVKVNNKVIDQMGFEVDPQKDKIYFEGKLLKIDNEMVYIILNKPMGVVTTASDEKGRVNVCDLIDTDKRIYPVGRLDIDTTGLVILTNDGSLANVLMHPKHKIGKTYIVTVEGRPNGKQLNKLREGLNIRDLKTQKADVKILKNFDKDSIIKITIYEGQNHQIKRMFSYIGHKVKKLKRISMGEISLEGLEIGNYRYLNKEEIKYLRGLK
ncbi:pseudouridine synthase [Peptoniphilus raoultii]|uniref:pseudouridine synthase n=1 Tax=Peptoniphilus raoultii TaxID=1776387 RepID=UPI0008DAE729|nr:pseudouridine synthase [Peptoniphilus raoultii]